MHIVYIDRLLYNLEQSVKALSGVLFEGEIQSLGPYNTASKGGMFLGVEGSFDI